MLKKACAFIKENEISYAITIILFYLYFSAFMNNTSVGLDTFEFLYNPGYYKTDLTALGRPGRAWLHMLFFDGKLGKFSMFYAQNLTFIFYVVALVLVTFYLYKLSEGKIKVYQGGLFFLAFLVHPIWIEQFYFTMMITEVAIGFCLIILALMLSYDLIYCFHKEKFMNKIVAIALMFIAFTVYQEWEIVYIGFCAVSYIVWAVTHKNEFDSWRNYLKEGLQQAVLFVAAYVFTTVICNKFFMDGSYIDSYINWGKVSKTECINNILGYIKDMVNANGVFYTVSYDISIILLVIALIVFIVKDKRTNKEFLILATIVLELTPYLLIIYCGSVPVPRTQYIVPFVIAANLMLGIYLLKSVECPTLKKMVTVGTCICLLSQYYTASLLQYTWQYTRDYDTRMVREIDDAIQNAMNGQIKPVAFIGSLKAPYNNGSELGLDSTNSIFDAFAWCTPRYYVNSGWIVSYMHAFGINYTCATEEQFEEARYCAKDMLPWPNSECIKDMGDYVIIKLSEDRYAEEDGIQLD